MSININIDITKNYSATAINRRNGKKIKVKSTTDHPMSSFNLPVWIDKNNNALGQINLVNPDYDFLDIKEI